MKKFYANFKKVVAAVLVASMTFAASCSYDDSGIKEQINQIEKDLTALTERVAALEKRLGDEVAALTELIKGKVVVTKVEKDGDATKVILSDGTSFTVYPECTVVDTDTDTNTYISVAEKDGVLYYAIYEKGEFKEWLLVNGEMVPIYDGNDQDDNVCDNPYEPVAPMFKVEGDAIMVSIDGGLTWVESGLSAAAAGAQIFSGVVVNENNTVTFTLADGTTFDVVIAELIEFAATRGQVFVKANETKDIAFTINDAVVDINVMNQPLGWKASVAAAPVAEEPEAEEPEADVLAAGGTDYILTVTAPSSEFVASGFAEKSGVVAIHFNTAAGACKVARLEVDLAQITMAVDKEGNVTIVNSLIDSYVYTDWYGNSENITEFNNYYFVAMDIEDYNEDLASLYNDGWGEFNVPAIAGWINNFFYNVNSEYNTFDKCQYVDGVNEEWTVKFHLSEAIEYLDWYNQLSYEGNSFMVIVIPTDINESGAPIWDQHIAIPFKQLNINIEEIADARKFNTTSFNATLRGGTAYHLYPYAKAELDNIISMYPDLYPDYAAFFETALSDYLAYPDWSSFGFEITTDVKEENIALNDLLGYTSEWAYFETTPNTEYVMAYFAKEEGKTEYTGEDLKYVEFATAPVVEAATPVEIVADYNADHGYFDIVLDVTVPETAAVVYSRWYDEEQLDADLLVEDLIANGWGKKDFSNGYTYQLSTNVDAPNTSKWLGILFLDAEGNYTLYHKEFKSKEVILNEATISIDSVEFTASSATITVAGVEDLEVAKFKTYIVRTDSNSYYQKTKEELETELAIKNNWLYTENEATNPIVLTRCADYASQFVGGKTYKVAVAAQFADGSVSNVAYGEYFYYAGAAEVTATKFNFLGGYDDYYETGYSGGNGLYVVRGTGFKAEISVNYNFRNLETGALTEGTYTYAGNTNDFVYGTDPTFSVNSCTLNGSTITDFMWGSTMTVTAEGITLNLFDAEGRALANVTYTGVPTIDDGSWNPTYAVISGWQTIDEYHFIYVSETDYIKVNWYNNGIYGSGYTFYTCDGEKTLIDSSADNVFSREYDTVNETVTYNCDLYFQDGSNKKFTVTVPYTIS